MSYKEVQQLALKYAKLLKVSDRNSDFHEQRLKMWHFYVFFYSKLRSLLGDMEGNIRTLKEKKLDSQSLKMYVKLYHELLEIMKSTDKEKPYIMAERFAHYVLNGWGRAAAELDNLDFVIQHHLKKNEVDMKSGPMLGQSRVDTLQSLRDLAKQVRDFIKSNPTIPIPGIGDSSPPSEMIEAPPAPPQQGVTSVSVPSAKKRLI